MILGSHNSWSYLPVRKWWMRPIAFMARCQCVDIKTQYEQYGVRCFDLRVRFDGDGNMIVAHGIIEYKEAHALIALMWLDDRKDCYVRVLHEARSKKQYTKYSVESFKKFCYTLENNFKNTRFWCGKNLYNWETDYDFDGEDPTCDEEYASVCPPKLIDDWWPWLFAKTHNSEILARGTDKDILLIDYVNYGKDELP